MKRNKTPNLIGSRFGRLVVIDQFVDTRRTCCQCHCDCGKTHYVNAHELMRGDTKSCGCAWNRTHGMNGSPEYSTWEGMIQRCTNPKAAAYPHYGGRGITVCQRWRLFEHFYADMGPKPSPKLTLERVNNDKGYSPENCKWATIAEQALNKRPRRKLHA